MTAVTGLSGGQENQNAALSTLHHDTLLTGQPFTLHPTASQGRGVLVQAPIYAPAAGLHHGQHMLRHHGLLDACHVWNSYCVFNSDSTCVEHTLMWHLQDLVMSQVRAVHQAYLPAHPTACARQVLGNRQSLK